MAFFRQITAAEDIAGFSEVAKNRSFTFYNGMTFTIQSLSSCVQQRQGSDGEMVDVTDAMGRVKLYIAATIEGTGDQFDVVKYFVDRQRDVQHNERSNEGTVCALARQTVATLRSNGCNSNKLWIEGTATKKAHVEGLAEVLCGKTIKVTFVGTCERFSSFANNGTGGTYLSDVWSFNFVKK